MLQTPRVLPDPPAKPGAVAWLLLFAMCAGFAVTGWWATNAIIGWLT